MMLPPRTSNLFTGPIVPIPTWPLACILILSKKALPSDGLPPNTKSPLEDSEEGLKELYESLS